MREILKSNVILVVFLTSTFSMKAMDYKLLFYIDSISNISNPSHLPDLWTEVDPNESLSFGYNNNATVWCKLIISDTTAFDNKCWSFHNIHLDTIQFFSNNLPILTMGDRTNYQSKHLKSYTLNLDQITGTENIIIARIKKQWSFVDFSMSVDNNNIQEKETKLSLVLAFGFLGFALMLLTFNSYMAFHTKQRKYYLYIIYSSVGMIYVFVNMGIAKYYLFPSFIYFSEIRIFSGCYWYLFLGLFLLNLLDSKENTPLIYRAINVFQCIVAFLSLVSISLVAFDKHEFIIYPSFIIYSLFFVNITLLTIAVVRSIYKNHPWAWYVAISFLPHILWGLNMILLAFQIIDLHIKIDWIGIIVIYEMILFGWVLTQEFVETFKRNAALQTELIMKEQSKLRSIENARIKERRLIADLLHDKIGVDIAHIIHLSKLEKKDEVNSSLVNLGVKIRDLSHSILPKSLEHGALVEALQGQFKTMQLQHSNIQISFNQYDFPDQINSIMAQSLYLISLEIVQNSIIHAEPKTIIVEFYQYSDEQILSFSDDGKGFDQKTKTGFGLQNIQRRISDFGGNLTIHSSPNIGTSILIKLSRQMC
jgi:two-component system, sensor histidine kinase LadS